MINANKQKNREKQQNGKDQRSIQENQRYKENIHARMGMIKDRNGKDLRETEEIKKRQQEYAEELYKKGLKFGITMMEWSLTQSQTSLNVKSSRPQEASL